jgi:ankyrin repeat protein
MDYRVSAITQLIKAGAPIDRYHKIFLYSSRQCNLIYIILLVRANHNGHTSLHVAASQNLSDVCELLIRKGAVANVRDNDHRYPEQLTRDSKLKKILVS